MPKPHRRRVHRQSFDPDALRTRERPRYEAALPRSQWADQPFVYWPDTDRLIAPWPTHRAMTPDDQRRLLCVLDYVNAARPNCAVWLWPERREPEPIECDGDIRRWLGRWSEGRATYVARRAG